MTGATTAKDEGFMQQGEPLAAALPWLEDARALEKPAAGWVNALRETGADSFAHTGLPTPRWEGWQYTNLRPLAKHKFHYDPAPVNFDAAALPAPLLADAGRVVLVNGQYQEKLSTLPEGVEAASLMEAAAQKWPGIEDQLVRVGDLAQTPLTALNSAYLKDGFVLRVAKGRDIEQPVEVLYYNIGAEKDAQAAPAIYPRALYQLGENSGLTIIERHMGQGVYLANSYIAAAQDSASRLRFYRFMAESGDAFHFSNTALQQEKNGYFEGFSSATGGAVARQEFRLLLIDTLNSASIGGIYLLDGQQSHDFTILADHFEEGGKSAQHFKGVIDDQARAVFQGKIHVRRSAQKTDGYQSHHALLLSAAAEASAKPELEIYADDVKCSHGATSGFLDPVALFYLRSRGIPVDDAKDMLVESFLNENLEKVSCEPVRDLYRAQVSAWLAGRRK
ncbi:MAG: Fe-S cluster assembly protein SufD [Alphaproteobacteria bacterium]|nr:Fe-S cluster assembly protein SufD [Alphaproteobacteria bacterium]